jgi:hypothetical protein
MAITFDQAERSVAQNRPIELFQFDTPTVTYRVTSYHSDVNTGVIWTPLTMSRGDQQMAQDATGRELVVHLPITHPLVQRYCASGIPEHEVLVTAYRVQEVSQSLQQFHQGFAGGMSIDGHVALLRCPSLTDDAIKIRLPVITAQRLCNHVLYDAQCTVDRTTATFTSHALTAISGNTVTTDSIGSGDLYVFGDILHIATGQRRMVVAQSGSTLTLNMPFVGAQVGDLTKIAPGCDHTVQTCKSKFSNVINFGGHPDLNSTINLWAIAGLGVIQQT